MPERVAEEHQAQRIRKEEEAKVDTNPTEAQKEAGNYKKDTSSRRIRHYHRTAKG